MKDLSKYIDEVKESKTYKGAKDFASKLVTMFNKEVSGQGGNVTKIGTRAVMALCAFNVAALALPTIIAAPVGLAAAMYYGVRQERKAFGTVVPTLPDNQNVITRAHDKLANFADKQIYQRVHGNGPSL